MKKFSLGLLMLSLGLISLPVVAEDSVLMLMSEERDTRSQLLPIPTRVVTFFKFLEKNAGIKINIRRYPWKRALENTLQGEGLLFGISKTPQRMQQFQFSAPVFGDQVYLLTLCEKQFTYNSLQDLRGKTIGLVPGTHYGDDFEQGAGSVYKVEDDTSNNLARYRKLAAQRMDAFAFFSSSTNLEQIEQELQNEYAIEFPRKPNEPKLFCVIPKPVDSTEIHIATAHGKNKDVLQKIDHAIQQGRASGELARIFSTQGTQK